jgi:hypothetical protein
MAAKNAIPTIDLSPLRGGSGNPSAASKMQAESATFARNDVTAVAGSRARLKVRDALLQGHTARS